MTQFRGHVAFAGGASGLLFGPNPFGRKLYVSSTEDNRGETGVRRTHSTGASAIADAQAGDIITFARGTYTENLNFNKAGLTVVSANALWGYPDQVIIQGTTTVNADGVTFVGMEFFSNSATEACVQVGATTEAASFAALSCSFSSDGTTEPAYGLRIRGGNNHWVEGCKFVDCVRGFVIHSGITSYASGVHAYGNEYLECSTLDFGNTGAAGAAGAGYSVTSLVYMGNIHARGTAFVNITDTVGASNGYMALNQFRNATNQASVITIPAGILYGPNGTEAGWSTARPA